MTKLAVSSGDPAGIGPDICIKAFGSKTELDYSPVIFGDPNLFKERAKALGQKIDLQIYQGENEELLSNNCLWIKPHDLKQSVKPGEPDVFYAKYLIDLFEDAIDKTVSNEFNGLVTGPINKELMNKGVSTTIVDARFAKPLDQELILKCAREHEVMITIEEGSIGGFGSHVKNLLAEKGIFDKGLKFRAMMLPDTFIEQDNPKKMYDVAGLNASQISKKILDVLFTKDSIKVVKN